MKCYFKCDNELFRIFLLGIAGIMNDIVCHLHDNTFHLFSKAQARSEYKVIRVEMNLND